MRENFPDIQRRGRVVHSLYGRGVVSELNRVNAQARVLFDGERCERRVMLPHLTAEPKAMPANRPELTVVR